MLSKSHIYPRKPVRLDTGTEMITKQSHKDECDIYRILNQYQRTGIITHVQSAQARWEELPDPQDYQQSLHILMDAQEAFASLPSRVRAHFDNDPQQFLQSFMDPSQHDQLREFGLLKAKEASPADSATTPPA